jgi:2-haloacid dehalogenase
MVDVAPVRALVFDVFGTCVDWRTSVAREIGAIAQAKGVAVDGEAFADAWRGNYQPSMERVRSGERHWTVLDVLHRETLDMLLPKFGLDGLTEPEREHLNRIWHRLAPWPDVVAGLTRLKRRYIIATLSNGNVALLVNLAKSAGLPWDTVFAAETFRAYKPMPAVYRGAADLLRLEPRQVMLVAAHNGDLKAASAQGLSTAFVPRPTEYGPRQETDLASNGPWNVVAADFVDLAGKLGA